MAAVAMQVDLVESPPKTAEARKRQKRQSWKKEFAEEPPEADSKPVLRRKKGKQADPSRQEEPDVVPASPEMQKPQPPPEPIDAEATVTPPARKSRNSSAGKVMPLRLSFYKGCEIAGQPPAAPKAKAKSVGKGKKPSEAESGASPPPVDGKPAAKTETDPKAEVSSSNAAQPEAVTEKVEKGDPPNEVKEPRTRLLQAFAKAVPGLKNGETVLLEEPQAETEAPAAVPADEAAAASPDAKPKASTRKKKKEEAKSKDAGVNSGETVLVEEPQAEGIEAKSKTSAAVAEPRGEAESAAPDAKPKAFARKKKKEEAKSNDSGPKNGATVLSEEAQEEATESKTLAAASEPSAEASSASPDAKPKASARKKKKEEAKSNDAGASDAKGKPSEATATQAETEAPQEGRSAKDAGPKRKKQEQKAAQEQGSANNKDAADAEAVENKADVPTESRPESKAASKKRKKEAKTGKEEGQASSEKMDIEAVAEPAPAPAAEPAESEKPKPDAKAAVKRKKKEAKPGKETAKPKASGVESSAKSEAEGAAPAPIELDAEEATETAKMRPDAKAATKRKKKEEKAAKEQTPAIQKIAGSPNGKWRLFNFRRREPAASKAAGDDDEVREVIDVEAQKQKKRKFDWRAGFAKVQQPLKCPGVLVTGRPKAKAVAKAPEAASSSATNPNAGPKTEMEKEPPKPEKVLTDWADKHAPKTQKQLRPIKAWEQFRDWLKDWRPGGGRRKAALVVGVPGSGKSAGVRYMVRRLCGNFLEHDLEETAGRNFIENMSKKQRDGRQMYEDLVFVCNLNEAPTAFTKDWLAQALQVARTPVIFVANEGMITSKDTALWKQCLEIRISLAEIFITRKLTEVSRLEERPLPEGLCEQVAAASPGDLRRALRSAQLLSTAATTDDAFFPEAALAPITAAGQLLGTSNEVIPVPKSLDLIALDVSVAPILRWSVLDALHFFFPQPSPFTGADAVPEVAPQESDAAPALSEAAGEEIEALRTCARIASLVAESDAAAGWAEAAVEKAGSMPSEAADSPAAAEPLLLACLAGEVQRFSGQKVRKGQLQIKRALPDPVCPIPTDQIAILTRQLGVPKAWVEDKIFDWIVATRSHAPSRTLKNFRPWAKKQADRHIARQGAREAAQMARPVLQLSGAEMTEPIVLEPDEPGPDDAAGEGAEGTGEPDLAAEGAGDAGAMDAEGAEPTATGESISGPGEAAEEASSEAQEPALAESNGAGPEEAAEMDCTEGAEEPAAVAEPSGAGSGDAGAEEPANTVTTESTNIDGDSGESQGTALQSSSAELWELVV